MEYENMRLSQLKSLARDRGLRNYSRIRKAELVALLQDNGRAPAPPPPTQRCARALERSRASPPAYVTLKCDDNGSCRIHSVSDGDKEIVTNERYVVMPWKVVTMNGKIVTLAEAVDSMFSHQESEAKEQERREAEREEIERKRAEYYEVHIKSETERLNNWVDWYEVKLNEIREAPVDERLQKLGRLYRISERNKHTGVTITSSGVINPVAYPPELKIPEYEDPKDFVSPFCDIRGPNDPVRKEYDQVDHFKKVARSYRGRDDDADKYVKKVKPLIDCSQLDDPKLEEVRIAMAKVKCP